MDLLQHLSLTCRISRSDIRLLPVALMQCEDKQDSYHCKQINDQSSNEKAVLTPNENISG